MNTSLKCFKRETQVINDMNNKALSRVVNHPQTRGRIHLQSTIPPPPLFGFLEPMKSAPIFFLSAFRLSTPLLLFFHPASAFLAGSKKEQRLTHPTPLLTARCILTVHKAAKDSRAPPPPPSKELQKASVSADA